MDIIQQISNNPYVTLSGWIATIIALVLSITFYFIQKKRKIISYFYKTNILVSEKLTDVEGLNISYGDNSIERLSVTNLEITNGGNIFIDESDIYHKKKLKFVLENKNIRVLFAKITDQSSDTIEGSTELNENEVNINFQALEKNDTIKINVYHTGNTETKFRLIGKIKDGGKIIEGKVVKTENSFFSKYVAIFAAGVVLSTFILLIVFLSQISQISNLQKENLRMQYENNGLRSRYEKLEKQNNELEAKNTELENTIFDLNDQIKRQGLELYGIEGN